MSWHISGNLEEDKGGETGALAVYISEDLKICVTFLLLIQGDIRTGQRRKAQGKHSMNVTFALSPMP